MVPAWAHDGGTAKLLERLRDPAARAANPQGHGDTGLVENNAWQEISGPEAILIGAVQNPALLGLQGKTLAQIAKEKKPIPSMPCWTC